MSRTLLFAVIKNVNCLHMDLLFNDTSMGHNVYNKKMDYKYYFNAY